MRIIHRIGDRVIQQWNRTVLRFPVWGPSSICMDYDRLRWQESMRVRVWMRCRMWIMCTRRWIKNGVRVRKVRIEL